eukprot:634796-Prymnesium_polylepis.1
MRRAASGSRPPAAPRAPTHAGPRAMRWQATPQHAARRRAHRAGTGSGWAANMSALAIRDARVLARTHSGCPLIQQSTSAPPSPPSCRKAVGSSKGSSVCANVRPCG